jgi:hypothetical protein
MTLFFALTLFASATLLFLVQPMFARMALPLLGGTPAVWNTCLVFYQAALLAGYLYAHLGVRRLSPRGQAILHLVIMAVPWLVLPIALPAASTPPAEGSPIPWLMGLLCVSIGLPFFVVSASAPLLQSWFSRTGHRSADDPYFLYAASNLGSLVALLAYPFLLEPTLTLATQARLWAAGYGVLTLLVAGCAAFVWRNTTVEAAVPPGDSGAAEGPPPTGRQRLRWLALALVPSSLLLGVTTHISTDLAAVPLLWIVPLALYLLSFVIVFARRSILPHRWMVFLQPFVLVPLAMVFFRGTSGSFWGLSNFWWLVGLHLVAFFVTALVCHGELARTRPPASRLTEFYLWMSLGGVLGGVFSAILAPTVFPWIGDRLWALVSWAGGGAAARHARISPNVFYMILEYPLMLAVACGLRPRFAGRPARPLTRGLVFGLPALLLVATAAFLAVVGGRGMSLDHVWQWTMLGREFSVTPGNIALAVLALAALVWGARPLWFTAGVAAVLAFGFYLADPYENVIYMHRSFFGVLRVSVTTIPGLDDTREEVHTLLHGSTNHGMQLWVPDPVRRNRPQSYYFSTGPVGDLFLQTPTRARPRHIGVIGLGTATTAGYARPQDRITYFEIDPQVVRIAKNEKLFTYWRDCPADRAILLGDARLRLAEVPDRTFHLLLVDAFSSDAIPIHLLTREAFRLYFDKLADDGLLAVHVSNRHLTLAPLVARLAEDAGAVCRVRDDSSYADESDDDSDETANDEAQVRYLKCNSEWVAVVKRAESLGDLRHDPEWQPIEIPPGTPCWTDDFSNILSALKN